MSITHDITFDIVGFIEKNPLSRLSSIYQNTLINKIKRDFNEEDQKIFVTSFYSYLNFNPLTDFIIDFDDVWKWCGYTRKDQSKRVLEKHFVVNVDYKILLRSAAEQVHGGSNKEKISLNILTFKKFCLKADTKKADEIHNYYIKLETILQETLNEESNELRLQLEAKNEESNELIQQLEDRDEELEKSQQEVKKLEKKYIRKSKLKTSVKNVVYLMSSEESEKVREYVVGKATDLSNRLKGYDNNKLHNFNVVYYRVCSGVRTMDIVESMILSKLGKYRCKAGRDVFLLPETMDIKLFTNTIDECVNFLDCDDKGVVYPRKTTDEDDVKEKKKEYYEENKEQLKEKSKQYMEENKEILPGVIAEYQKNRYQENFDRISEKYKEYYQENKEKIIEQVLGYYEDNKEMILEDRKEHYENNKEIILEERKKYYDENYKTKILTQRQAKEQCECGVIVTHYCMKKHKSSERHKIQMSKLETK